MFAKVSKEGKISRDMLSSVRIHGPRVADKLDEKLASYLGEGRAITGTADIQEAMVNWIESEIVKVEIAENAHLDDLARLKRTRKQRDDEKSELYKKVLDVRNTFENVIGEGESWMQVGLDAGLAKVPAPELRRYARRALEKLEDPDFKPVPKVPGAKLDPSQTAADLRPTLSRFEKTLEELGEQERLKEETQRLKNATLDDLNFLIVNGTGMLQAFYNLADESFHAQRIRQTLRSSPARKPSSDEAATGDAVDLGDDPPEESAAAAAGDASADPAAGEKASG